ncbi:acyclic terpene utilization AtuA family protein [Streptomyces sp. NRRL S-87]|uniref:acyclic terpene utilization AtuA family protein n=1 Tax=Streptomyces sp. NRRL S-87 TaxID=1463920 RepID=UPI00099D446D|nr:acyclic terpene utilization AtuA family protein [Streptomyces sp. NRRL S-87]
MRDRLLIGNASGFYGDRFSALREMLTGGPLDVLTGDYLAELTMVILGKDRLKDPGLGYAKTYLRQLEEGLGLAHERGVRLVANAGGLNPAGLADAIRKLAARLGVPVSVAHVEGDDLMPYAPVPDALTANAYLGGWGITACLRAGADVVVTGRVTDAALVSGPAAWFFDWAPDDYDALAGAVVAGHVLECGTQSTGGNYAFFTRHDVRRPGFPLAEIARDGSAVITKHPGTGGVVDTGTVTAQLLYETQGARYEGPDAVARLDTVRLADAGPDRVAISGVRGEAPPPTLKAGLTRIGGWRNEVVFVLTGLDIEAKAALVRDQLADTLAGIASVRWELSRTDHADAPTEETASALLRLVVRDPAPDPVGRPVTSRAIELALASYPGFHVTAPPAAPTPYGVFSAAPVPAAAVPHTAVLPDGTRVPIRAQGRAPGADVPRPAPAASQARGSVGGAPGGTTRRVPLGRIAGARSGDKGGDANIGVWVETAPAWTWLRDTLTVDALKRLLPETAPLPVTRHELPHLRALNFVVPGLLGEGVAAQHRFDPQAKALGEWLRSRHVDVPAHLLDAAPPAGAAAPPAGAAAPQAGAAEPAAGPTAP